MARPPSRLSCLSLFPKNSHVHNMKSLAVFGRGGGALINVRPEMTSILTLIPTGHAISEFNKKGIFPCVRTRILPHFACA